MGFRQRNFLKAGLTAALLAVPTLCQAGTGAKLLSAFIIGHVFQEVLIAFWGISLATLLYYGANMVINSAKDQAYTDTVTSFTNAIIGFIVISAASTFAASFQIYNPSGIGQFLATIAGTLVRASAGIFALMATIAGFQMVLSQGEEGEITKWQKVLLGNVIGVMIMFVSSVLVNAVFDPQHPEKIIEEVKGIALFMLTLLGFAGAISLVIAGIMLIISIDESLRDRAKKIVIGTLITLGVVLACYTLILTFA